MRQINLQIISRYLRIANSSNSTLITLQLILPATNSLGVKHSLFLQKTDPLRIDFWVQIRTERPIRNKFVLGVETWIPVLMGDISSFRLGPYFFRCTLFRGRVKGIAPWPLLLVTNCTYRRATKRSLSPNLQSDWAQSISTRSYKNPFSLLWTAVHQTRWFLAFLTNLKLR